MRCQKVSRGRLVPHFQLLVVFHYTGSFAAEGCFSGREITPALQTPPGNKHSLKTTVRKRRGGGVGRGAGQSTRGEMILGLFPRCLFSGTAGAFRVGVPCPIQVDESAPGRGSLGLLLLLQKRNNRLPRHEALKQHRHMDVSIRFRSQGGLLILPGPASPAGPPLSNGAHMRYPQLRGRSSNRCWFRTRRPHVSERPVSVPGWNALGLLNAQEWKWSQGTTLLPVRKQRRRDQAANPAEAPAARPGRRPWLQCGVLAEGCQSPRSEPATRL